MIQLRAAANTAPLDLFADWLDSFNDVVARIAEDVREDYAETITRRLSDEPPRRQYPNDYPLEWESERQRRAYFATNGFGKGIPYTRTGALAKGWQVVLEQQPGSFQIVVINRSSAARYVYGSLAQDGQRYQQRFHAKTGWPTAAPIIGVYIEAMLTDFAERFRQELADFGRIARTRTRATTR